MRTKGIFILDMKERSRRIKETDRNAKKKVLSKDDK